MKHVITLPSIFLFIVACNAMADESYKHEYNNGGHFEGLKKAVVVESSKKPVAGKQENDPYKLVTDSEGNINLDALPPTATGPEEKKAPPKSE